MTRRQRDNQKSKEDVDDHNVQERGVRSKMILEIATYY
jgi:hypothetical protein